MSRALAARCLASTLAFVAVGACSAAGGNKTGQSVGNGSGGSGATTGAGGLTGGGTNGTGNVTFFTGSTTGAGGSTGALIDGCPAIVSKPEQVTTTVTTQLPLDMFIMYDQSGSMNESAGNTTKWDAIKTALTGFVNDPASAGIGVGIQYFPLQTGSTTCVQGDPNCACLPCCFFGFCLPNCPASGSVCTSTAGGDCTVADYATPDVPIEMLTNPAATDIVNSLNAHNPGQGTPTVPALTGAIQYASAYAATHLGDGGIPYRKTIVVLATDGDPNDCNSTVQGVADVAAQGLAANPSIQTFVIGVGSSLTSLNTIAAAGGTNQAFIVDTASDPTAQFEAAMNQIRTISTQQTTITTPVPCEWKIPAPPTGTQFDKTKVNVSIDNVTIGHVQTTDAGSDPCAGVTQSAWYYDSETNPTTVLLCPTTCDTVKAETSPTVGVVFGCDTVEVIK